MDEVPAWTPMPPGDFQLGGYSLRGLIRRVRRTAELSQRDLARAAQIAPSTIAAIETGAKLPSLPVLQRILNTAHYRLVVVDCEGRTVLPLWVYSGVRDLAGRRFPAHIDLIIDPVGDDWWATKYGLTRPPETFRRVRAFRDAQRRRSQWEVRVKQFRHVPPPADLHVMPERDFLEFAPDPDET